MNQHRRAIVGVADRWSIFFDKLGWGDNQAWVDSIRRHGYSRSFFVNEIQSHCMLSPKDPSLESRTFAREFSAENKNLFIFLVGCPSNASMRNWIYVPPQTPEEWERYNNPRVFYSGWYLGNFADGPDGEVHFNRLQAEPLILGKSDGLSVFDSFVASMAIRGSL